MATIRALEMYMLNFVPLSSVRDLPECECQNGTSVRNVIIDESLA